jgi:outer membrane lipoprotein SlyB
MKSTFSVALALNLIALSLAGCAAQTTAPDAATTTPATAPNARCEQTGSNLPRRDCRDVEVLKPNQIESLKGSNRPTSSGN